MARLKLQFQDNSAGKSFGFISKKEKKIYKKNTFKK